MLDGIAEKLDSIYEKNTMREIGQDDGDFLMAYIDILEAFLDDGDSDGLFGPDGWRSHLGSDE